MDSYQKYWREALECALDELGLFNTLISEQYDAAAKSLSSAAEMQSMAFGHDCIPDPRDEVERKLKAQIKRAEAETDEMRINFKKNVAMRHGCDITDVTIEEDGNAYVLNSRL